MPRIQRSPSRRTVAVGVVGLVLLIAAAVAAAVMSSTSSSSTARQVQFGGDRELSPALQKKLAVSQTFAPGETQYEGSQEAGDGASDWAMHSTPGNDISLSVINASRLDWDALKARDNIFDEHGKLANLGPDNAVYPLNQFRNRYVYVPGQYVAAGRTVHSVIDPKCSDTACRLWIANAGGGVWRTDNALAAQPAWTYLSGSFDHNNTAALELDPNDATSNTIYAGTGEANICRSGCLAGVGLYKSKDGGEHWKHLGEQYLRRSRDRLDPGEARRLLDDLRRERRAGLARHQQHVLQRRRPRRQHPRRAALRRLAFDGRRRDVRPREPGQRDELHVVHAAAGVPRHDCLLAARGVAHRVRPDRPEHGVRAPSSRRASGALTRTAIPARGRRSSRRSRLRRMRRPAPASSAPSSTS